MLMLTIHEYNNISSLKTEIVFYNSIYEFPIVLIYLANVKMCFLNFASFWSRRSLRFLSTETIPWFYEFHIHKPQFSWGSVTTLLEGQYSRKQSSFLHCKSGNFLKCVLMRSGVLEVYHTSQEGEIGQVVRFGTSLFFNDHENVEFRNLQGRNKAKR